MQLPVENTNRCIIDLLLRVNMNFHKQKLLWTVVRRFISLCAVSFSAVIVVE